MEELWKPIPGFEGAYEASNLGNIRSISRRVWRSDIRREEGGCFHWMPGVNLKPSVGTSNTSRYPQVMLSYTPNEGQKASKRRYYSVHRLVWAAFNGPIPNGYEIHHLDGDRNNPALANLECLAKHVHRKLTNEVKMGGGVEWLVPGKSMSSREINQAICEAYKQGYQDAKNEL